jgi:hypothetical protein
MGQAHLATAFPTQPTEPFGPWPKQGSTEALNGGVDSGKRRRSEVGLWVGEMAGEVGDSIWPPVKEEAHQSAMSTGARLSRMGTAVRGGVRWWRSAARDSGRSSGHGRSLGRCRRSASVAGGGWCWWHHHSGNGWWLGAWSLEDEAPLDLWWGRQLQSVVHKASAAAPCVALWSERRLCSVDRGVVAKEQRWGMNRRRRRKDELLRRCAPLKAARGGGWWWRERWAGTVGGKGNRNHGHGKLVAATLWRCSVPPRRLCSDRETDWWAPHSFDFFFQFIQNHLNFKNLKWVPYIAPKFPNFCMRLTWDIINNFLNCSDIQFQTQIGLKNPGSDSIFEF